MNSTGSLLSRTLQEITTTKLQELTKKRENFERVKNECTVKARSIEDPVKSLAAWSEGVKKCFGVSTRNGSVVRGSTLNPRLEVLLQNIDRFLGQARYDPSISPDVLAQWQQALERQLEMQSLKYTYATLYGQLTTEWLTFRQPKVSALDADTSMEDYEHLSSTKKLEARAMWEEGVFQPAGIDVAAIQAMLQASFAPEDEAEKHVNDALTQVRKGVKDFETLLSSTMNFDERSLGWTIRSLLASDLLTDEKREVLQEFQSSSVILTEVADVLNMWMAAVGTWSWGEVVNVEERRRVDGTFSIYMHEDLLHAIFLHYIGTRWSVALKRIFKDHRRAPNVWKRLSTVVSLEDRKRRDYYLGSRSDWRSINLAREKLYSKKYFLAQLANSEEQEFASAEGEEEADFDEFSAPPPPQSYMPVQAAMGAVQAPSNAHFSQQTSAKRRTVQNRIAQRSYRARKIASLAQEPRGPDDSDSDDATSPRNPMDSKQTLLHLLSTEILIKTRLQGDITCFRSQFERFYPSIPHETILATLKFFGVSLKWSGFFQSFLQPPLRFLDEPGTASRTRRRGVPGSNMLSEVFGELILFTLDYQVSQATGGEPLWRMHDDFWFWSAKTDSCEAAWKTVTSFTKTMGLGLNESRTGCVRIRRENNKLVTAEPPNSLPRGEIRWGMLFLNAETGRFEIDAKMVDKHIEELSKQLRDKSGSVFAWIQAWNTYAATFFTSNFGTSANCFGLAHVNSMLETHNRIQRVLFSSLTDEESKGGSVVDFLKQTIGSRFGIEGIPDGYFFFPVELGGLDVKSPFVTLLQVRDSVLAQPEKLMDDFELAERRAYQAAKKAFDQGDTEWMARHDPDYRPSNPYEFMSFEEYTRYREELNYGFNDELVNIFSRLLDRPEQEGIDTDQSGPISAALTALPTGSNLRSITSNFYTMEPYWRWVVQLYGTEVVDRFGGLSIVDSGLLPTGMVGLFRSGRVKWQE